MISCLCPTFNRAPSHLHLLEECVESFRRQDRPPEAELVIVNDTPGQTLVCDAPGVRIINLPVRMPTLGDKYNLLVELARGDVLLPWEDDDISLPGRVRQAVAMLGSGPPSGYWKPPQVWFLDGDGLHWRHNVGVRHHASAFTRQAWERVGGYPAVSGNQDALMDQLLGGHVLPSFPAGIPVAAWQYIYRWGVSPNHLSGSPDPEAAYREGGQHIERGTFRIVPRWREDYAALCRQAAPPPHPC